MTYTETLKLDTTTCCVCGITFGLPEEFLRHLRNEKNEGFFCPNGHNLQFRKSELQQEIDRLKNKNNEAEWARMSLHNQLTEKQKEISKLRANIKRRNKRTIAGVCPCCNRTVKELADHIKSKHPEMLEKINIAPIHEKINKKK